MNYRKYRWSKDYEAAEEELELLLARIGRTSDRYQLAEYEAMENQKLPIMRRLWCAEGSIMLTVAGKAVSLQPGDAIDIEPGVEHKASAGVAGCVWYEARP